MPWRSSEHIRLSPEERSPLVVGCFEELFKNMRKSFPKRELCAYLFDPDNPIVFADIEYLIYGGFLEEAGDAWNVIKVPTRDELEEIYEP